MKEMSVAEQRYKAVLAVIGDGRAITEVRKCVIGHGAGRRHGGEADSPPGIPEDGHEDFASPLPLDRSHHHSRPIQVRATEQRLALQGYHPSPRRP
jgi:hypothetical protein